MSLYNGYRRVLKQITPENVKKARLAYDSGKKAYSMAKTLLNKSNRNFAKPKSRLRGKAVSRTRLRKQMANSGEGDSGIKRYRLYKTLNPKPKYRKGTAYPKWSTLEYANVFSFASSTGTVPGTNQLNRQKIFTWPVYHDSVAMKIVASSGYVNGPAAFTALDPQLSSQTLTGSTILGDVSGTLEFTNQEQSNLVMTIYMYIAKKNMEVLTAPDTCWETGIDEQAGNRGTANVNNHMPNAVPSGKYLSDRWKLGGKVTIEMAAGLTARFNWRYKINKIVDISTMFSFAAIKDCTFYFMGVMRGTPVDFDATQTHGPATLVGYAPSKIVGVSTYKYSVKGCPVEVPKNTYQLNQISGTAPTTVWELNDEDGKPVNIFAATNVA